MKDKEEAKEEGGKRRNKGNIRSEKESDEKKERGRKEEYRENEERD